MGTVLQNIQEVGHKRGQEDLIKSILENGSKAQDCREKLAYSLTDTFKKQQV